MLQKYMEVFFCNKYLQYNGLSFYKLGFIGGLYYYRSSLFCLYLCRLSYEPNLLGG